MRGMESVMSRGQGERDEAVHLLAAAAKAISAIRYCWLATAADGGFINTRPMGRTPRDPDEDEWMIRFVTDGRSHKVKEIGRVDEVAITFQDDTDDAYVTLSGRAAIRRDAAADHRHWRSAYNVYFPGEGELRHAAFIEIRVDRMDLWIRGVTPEPFGSRGTRLHRDAAGLWRLAA